MGQHKGLRAAFAARFSSQEKLTGLPLGWGQFCGMRDGRAKAPPLGMENGGAMMVRDGGRSRR